MMRQKYYGIILGLAGCSAFASKPDISIADDLLAGCGEVANAFQQDAKELQDLLGSLANVASALNDVTQTRQNTFNGYTKQLQNYQNLLAQEQQNLALLQEKGVADQSDVQNKIDQLNVEGTSAIDALQVSIGALQQAVKTLQENLSTISNLTQSRVDGVNQMVNAYGDFEGLRLSFKDQLDGLLDQIRSYIGTTAVQDNNLLQS
ncbi:hypothetical protein EKK58_04490 [Candidatus Dependentiae bacterium]|nr:MAG: hypothetical protein EKK58_04490 [Candidatus Dependentiae bacterium]